MTGKQSITLNKPVYIIDAASIVGKKEGEGPLGQCFDVVEEDPKAGGDTWEEAESRLQKAAAQLVLNKAHMKKENISYIFSGDLLGQLVATSFGLIDLNIPIFGLYGACSTIGEALSLGAVMTSAGYAQAVMAITSSHFASAEKEFRFPLEYANQRALSTTWTVTGSGAFILGTNYGRAKITEITTGKMIDYGIKDSMNMGAAMAPAAADLIEQNLIDFNRVPEYYDCIVTGDLGKVGQDLLFELLHEKKIDIEKQHMDCGIEIYDAENQDTHAGGSGCGCSAVTLASYILPKIESGEWRRILFVPTGALLSKVSFNEGKTIPGIAHGVILEHS